MENENINENLLYTWNFSENKNRGKTWYIIAISLAIGFIFWGIYSGLYGLSIVIFLIFGLIFFMENNYSDDINVEISTLGVKIGSEFFEFSKIKYFGFVYEKGNAVFLRLFLNQKMVSNLNLRIDNKICEDLKQILPNFIEEGENTDLTFSEKLINFLKL